MPGIAITVHPLPDARPGEAAGTTAGATAARAIDPAGLGPALAVARALHGPAPRTDRAPEVATGPSRTARRRGKTRTGHTTVRG